MMYLINWPDCPVIVVKGHDPEDALTKFKGHLTLAGKEYFAGQEVKAIPLTIELLESLTPDQFSVESDPAC